MLIKDPLELDAIIKGNSVLVKDEEVQKLSNELYPTLLMKDASQSIITESSSPIKVDELEREA